MWQLCFWCHSLPQTTPPLQTHTHSQSLGLSASTHPLISLTPFFFLFSHPTAILPQTETWTLLIWIIQYQNTEAHAQRHTHKYAACTCPFSLQTVCAVCWLAFLPVYSHIYTFKERERWSGAQIYVLVLSEWKLLFSSHVCCSANQASASVMKWEEKHLYTATDEATEAWPGTHMH